MFQPRLLLPAVALAVTAAALAAPASGPAPASDVRFASPTVVDELVPGFEPDVVVDASHTASRGRLYSSWPNGFSTTVSYLERSDDNGLSFHRAAGSVAGKLATCVGGGDTELQVSRKDGQLLFADLQGLTNFTTASSKDGGNTFSTSCVGITGAGVDRQWIAVDDNGGTSSIGTGSNDGRAYLVYDNIFQNTGGSLAGNSPVINASSDGVNYGGCVDPTAILCKAPAAVFSTEDDIVGNVWVNGVPSSPRYHEINQVRGNSSSNKVLFSTCRGAPTGKPTTAAETAAACTNPDLVDPTDPGRVNTSWVDHTVATMPKDYQVQSFVVGAMDTAGNVYVTWSQYKAKDGAFASTGQVMMASSKDGGLTWSKPVQLNSPAEPSVIFPWITAGDPGRVAVVWYGAPQHDDHGDLGPDPLYNGTWDVTMAQSTDALSSTPTISRTRVSDHIVKYGDISTGGLGGAADRSLGDYLMVSTGLDGEAVVSYVDDTSGNRNNDLTSGSGQDPPEASGPTMVARQIAGPSLFAAKGNLGTARPATDSVTDPTGVGYPDAYLGLAGQIADSSPALDLAGASITQPDADHLQVQLRTADPQLADHLAPSPTLGGVFANWRVRWAGRYGTSGKDGQIWYVGMQAGPDGAPEFYVGKTASIDTTRTKYFAYPTGTAVPGAIDKGVITWTVPLDAIGSPKPGDGLYSVTGFTATSAIPDEPILTTVPTGSGQVGDEDTLTANQIDAAPSFSFTLPEGGAPVIHGPGPGQVGKPGGKDDGNLAATGLGWQLPLLAVLLLLTGAALHRRRTTA
ncbi:MAG: repeat-like domain protein [Frankiales bacterium]|nr:repeat-like domain protein [Frankiales bacterium]